MNAIEFLKTTAEICDVGERFYSRTLAITISFFNYVLFEKFVAHSREKMFSSCN